MSLSVRVAPNTWWPVATLGEASRSVRLYIDSSGIGFRACVQDAYVRRIAELQARYRLVPGTGPVTYVCDGNPADEVVATYFQTDPPTLIATRGDGQSLMFLQPSGSGARYQGRNESLWEHQGEALVTWGAGAPEMRCRRR